MNTPAPIPIVDTHVHLVGIDVMDCYIAPTYRRGLVYRLLKNRLGLDGVADADLNTTYLRHLQQRLDDARGLDAVVLLAFDARYDRSGHRDLRNTTAYISNDYLFEACRQDPRFLPGASVNPNRRDALDELDRVAALGAVLIKTVPNSQDFDPADPAFEPFWTRMASLGLPWLTHTGKEHTVPVTQQVFGDPERLEPALKAGVTVIAAHAGTGGFLPHRETFSAFVSLIDRYPNLYGDISALGSLGRAKYLLPIIDGSADGQTPLLSRMIYGSDYPVPTSPLRFAHRLGLRQAWSIGRAGNLLSTPFALVRALGLPQHVLERGWQVLRVTEERRQAVVGTL